jgi:hypothetical protein
MMPIRPRLASQFNGASRKTILGSSQSHETEQAPSAQNLSSPQTAK